MLVLVSIQHRADHGRDPQEYHGAGGEAAERSLPLRHDNLHLRRVWSTGEFHVHQIPD